MHAGGVSMLFLITSTMIVLLALLVWTWWAGRTDRDPVGSVDSFHRALAAMRPEHRGAAPPPDRGDQPSQGDPTDAVRTRH